MTDTRLQKTTPTQTQAVAVQPRVEEVMLHLFMMTMTFYHAHRDIKMTPQVLFVLRSLYRRAKSQDASLTDRYASLLVAMDEIGASPANSTLAVGTALNIAKNLIAMNPVNFEGETLWTK